MRRIKYLARIISLSSCVLVLTLPNSGCKKLFGLEMQENTDHITSTIDPHIYKTAWQFLKDRALGAAPDDTIFKRMYQGVVYSGIDTNEYLKTGRTFIF